MQESVKHIHFLQITIYHPSTPGAKYMRSIWKLILVGLDHISDYQGPNQSFCTFLSPNHARKTKSRISNK